MRNWVQEFRYAVRVLSKSPAFSLVAVAVLALGIGAATAVFTVFNSVSLKPLPVSDPDHLYILAWKAHSHPHFHNYSAYGDCATAGSDKGCGFSVPFFEAARSSGAFATLAAFAGPLRGLEVSGGGSSPNIAQPEVVAGDYFSTLGVRVALGRALTAADDET